MNKKGLSGNAFNSTSTDYFLEVVVASLINQGYDPETIRVVRNGIARRGISKDVEEIYTQFSDTDLEKRLVIKTNREGIYDMLPEGLFHHSKQKRLNPDKEDITNKIKEQRQEEFFARKFFQIFEERADKTLIEAFLYETQYDRKVGNPEFVHISSQYWALIKELERKQAIFFIYIIPIVHKIRINFNLVGEAISLILNIPVEISSIKLPAKQAKHHFESKLGFNDSGVNFVLGNSFDDGEYDLKLIIGSISALRMRDFLETAKGYQNLEELCTLLLPADKFYQFEFIIDPADSKFILSNEDQTTYLGINSFI